MSRQEFRIWVGTRSKHMPCHAKFFLLGSYKILIFVQRHLDGLKGSPLERSDSLIFNVICTMWEIWSDQTSISSASKSSNFKIFPRIFGLTAYTPESLIQHGKNFSPSSIWHVLEPLPYTP